MSLTEKDKEFIISRYLEMVHFLSDKKRQESAWIDGKGLYAIDYDETCNFFFDDYSWLIDEHEKFDITDNQYQILRNFRDKFEAFSDENSWPPFFIDTPEWAEIMQEAEEVLKAFHYEKSDE